MSEHLCCTVHDLLVVGLLCVDDKYSSIFRSSPSFLGIERDVINLIAILFNLIKTLIVESSQRIY